MRCFALLILMATAAPAQGQFVFLGDATDFSPTGAGADVSCAPGARLRVRFLTDAVVRVTLDRPGVTDEPLALPLDAPERPPAVQAEETADGWRLWADRAEVTVHRSPCRVTLGDRGGLRVEDDPALGIGWDGPEVRTAKVRDPAERFYGLGEKTGPLDKAHREWTMWTSDIPAYSNDTDPLYQAVPFVIGVRGGRAYGLYLHNSSRSTFNLGAGTHRYTTLGAERGPLDYLFIAGPQIADVVDRYTALTGRPFMPPRWALGAQQSRWSYTPDSEVLRVAQTYREKAIPADVIYLDIGHMDGYRVFTWEPDAFPDPEGMLRQLEDIGFKTVVIIDPGVKEDPDYAVAQEGLAGDHFVRYPDGQPYVASVWPGRSYFPDFTSAATRDWWAGRLDAMLDQGVDGIWNDMNEPAVWGKAVPNELVLAGGPMRRMRNLYAYYMGQTAYEGLRQRRPDERPFVLTRAGFAGGQRHTAVWTGDNVSSWEHLALSVRMTLGMGLSGIPFNGADVGGFEGIATPELYARWIQAAAFSPLLRTHAHHDSPSQEPWSFGPGVEAIARDAISLRYRMLPTLYTLMEEAHRTGAPALRPLFWRFQDDPEAYRTDHQFLVGDHLLVAPVVEEGGRLQRVYLPAGDWLALDTGERYGGRQWVVVEAPLRRLPMFLRAGGLLVSQELVQHTGEIPAPILTVEAFPGGASGATRLYEDDGASFDFEGGAYRETDFEIASEDGAVVVTRTVGHDGYDVPARTLRLRLRDLDAPREVTADGQPVPASAVSYDPERRTLTVEVPERGDRQRVTVR